MDDEYTFTNADSNSGSEGDPDDTEMLDGWIDSPDLPEFDSMDDVDLF